MSRAEDNAAGRSRADGSTCSFQWLDPGETSAEAVRDRLLAEAALQIPGLSSDPSLTDPLVRLIMSAVAKEYSALYGKLDRLIDTAFGQLVDSLLSFPRAPQPASTVLKLGVAEPGTVVDDDFVVIGRMAVSGDDGVKERNLHFAPYGEQRIAGIAPPLLLRHAANGTVAQYRDGAFATVANLPPRSATWLHVGLCIPPSLELDQLPLFVGGGQDAVAAALASPWYLDENAAEPSFLPVRGNSETRWDGYGEPPVLRSRSDQRRPDSPFDQQFVHLDLAALRAVGPERPAAVAAAVAAGAITADPHRYWVSIRLDERAAADSLAGLSLLPNCIVAFNLKSEPARFKIGRVLCETVDLPVSYDQLFRIDGVTDSANTVDFHDAERSDALEASASYHLIHDPAGRARLRLLARDMPARPRLIEVSYVTTNGVQANGLAARSVDTIFNRRLTPGVTDAVSVTASAGGEASNRRPVLGTELRAQLLTRGRAVTRRDYAALARAYDPMRIAEVEVGRGVTRGQFGVTSCVQVTVHALEGAFYSDEHRLRFRSGLQQYLEARGPADQPVLVILE